MARGIWALGREVGKEVKACAYKVVSHTYLIIKLRLEIEIGRQPLAKGKRDFKKHKFV